MGCYSYETNIKNSMEEDKVIKGQPRSFTKKLKDVVEDKEHQIEILGTFVRLGVVVWSGFIITMKIDSVCWEFRSNSNCKFSASNYINIQSFLLHDSNDR